VGFLNFHFGPQTETHVTLPALQLDRSKFEVQLFALRPNPGDVENRCRSFADRFVVLGEALDAQVKTIREAGLDALVIGTNVTAVTNQITVLAMHRLAPVQLVSYCSPMSTGIPNVDGYLFGSLSEAKEIAADFSERLVTLDGPPGCLDYTNEAPAQARFSRADFGIEATAPVYVNAAACYKITPETVAAWGQILQQVPQSRLLLLPFNPNWSKSAPTGRFTRMLYAELAKHGVTAERVVIGNALPSRADVKEFEKLGNIYLDTFPFSGSLSVIDPLELGLPTVVVDGPTARGRAAAALLRDIAMPELICPDVSTYISTAVRLGTDAGHRAAVVAKLTRQMQSNPRFLDPAGYARRLGDQLTALVHGRKAARPAARRALAA
jgi:predicted O-linked N-acetylglucosamine transferase (SPINDLY family)